MVNMESKNIKIIKNLIKNKEYTIIAKGIKKKLAIQFWNRLFKGNPITGPILGGLLVSYKCNLKCSYCSLWKRYNPKHEASTADLFKYIDKLKDMGVVGIGLMGGEPTLRSDLTDLVRRIDNYRLVSSLVTNGTTMTINLASQLMEAGLDNLSFSIDSNFPSCHEVHRGEGNWTKAVTGATNAITAKNRLKCSINIGLNVVINSMNCRSLRDTIYWAKNFGFDNVYFMGMDEKSASKDIAPMNKVDKYILTDFLFDAKNEFGDFISNSKEFLTLLRKYQLFGKPPPYDCLAGYTSRYIDCYGNEFACNYDLQRNQPGNLLPKNCRMCHWPCQHELNLSMGCRV